MKAMMKESVAATASALTRNAFTVGTIQRGARPGTRTELASINRLGFSAHIFIGEPSAAYADYQRSLGRTQIVILTSRLRYRSRSEVTGLGSSRLAPVVFFSVACSRFAPGSVIILAKKTRSCSFP